MAGRTLCDTNANRLNTLSKFLSGRKLTPEEIALLNTRRPMDKPVLKH